MRNLILLSIFLSVNFTINAQQKCELQKEDWQKVKIYSSDSLQIDYRIIKAKCDVQLDLIPIKERKITTLADLTEGEIIRLKKRAAKYKCCSIILDIRVYDDYTSIGGGGYRYDF